MTATITTNSHILFAEFEYAEPATLHEVTVLLARDGAAARLIAGGTDLLVRMKLERVAPEIVVSLAKVVELRRLAFPGAAEIGATVTVRDLARSSAVRRDYQALAEACDAFSTVQVMVMGTLGGNLANASPAADTAPPLLAFGAEAEIVSTRGSRLVLLDDFFVGPGLTVLEPDEVLRSVRLPPPVPASASAFLKVGRVTADIAKTSAAVQLTRDGEHVAACRVALGAVAPTPIRAHAAEASLVGEPFSAELADEAARLAAEEDARPITDVRSTVDYRRTVTRVLVRDALTAAWARSRGEAP